MGRAVETFQQALTARNVMVRFAKAKEKRALTSDDLLKGKTLTRSRRMVERLSTLADEAEAYYKQIDDVPEEMRPAIESQFGEKVFGFLDQALRLAHKLAEPFDDLDPVYHALDPVTERFFRPVFTRYYELNSVYQRANKNALARKDAASVSADVHALYMAASALVSRYATSLRHMLAAPKE